MFVNKYLSTDLSMITDKLVDRLILFISLSINSRSRYSVFQEHLVPTKLGVARVDLVISIMLKSSFFSMCSHKPVWIYRDKRKFEFEFTIVQIFSCYSLI